MSSLTLSTISIVDLPAYALTWTYVVDTSHCELRISIGGASLLPSVRLVRPCPSQPSLLAGCYWLAAELGALPSSAHAMPGTLPNLPVFCTLLRKSCNECPSAPWWMPHEYWHHSIFSIKLSFLSSIQSEGIPHQEARPCHMLATNAIAIDNLTSRVCLSTASN